MPRDFLNREIKAGCTVVYPSRQGAGMWLNTLKITLVEEDQLIGFNQYGRTIHIKNIKNCVVVEPPEVPSTKEIEAKDEVYRKLYGG